MPLVGKTRKVPDAVNGDVDLEIKIIPDAYEKEGMYAIINGQKIYLRNGIVKKVHICDVNVYPEMEVKKE